jgi:hypothetical protein
MAEMDPTIQDNLEEMRRERVARLLGTTSDPISEIAVFTGTSDKTILEWMADTDFQKRVEFFQDSRLMEIRRAAFARKADRIESYSRDLQRLQMVIDARQRSFEEEGETPTTSRTGGISGIVIHKIKSVGSGDLQQFVDEYEVDTALLDQKLKIKRQLALELGEFEPAPTDNMGGTVVIQFTSDTPGPEDELAHE